MNKLLNIEIEHDMDHGEDPNWLDKVDLSKFLIIDHNSTCCAIWEMFMGICALTSSFFYAQAAVFGF